MSLDPWEEALARILRPADPTVDPIAALGAERERVAREGPAELVAPLAALDPEGVWVASRLVARLRFERLMNGDADAGRWYHADAAGFTQAFARYHHEVPATAFAPEEEATLWRAWWLRACR